MRLINFKSPSLNRKMFLRLISFLVVFTLGAGAFLYFTQPSLAAWSEGHTLWNKRKRLTLINNSSDSLASGTTVAVSINTKDLYTLGQIQSDCDDLRTLYQPNESTATELARHVVYSNNDTCSISESTKVYFKLQSALSAGASATDYYVYYANPAATAPTSTEDAFNVGSANATFVCPLRGSRTCVNAAGSISPTTATGSIRSEGLKSALQLDGVNDSAAAVDSSSLSVTGDLTIEAWIKPKRIDAEQTIVGKWDETTGTDDRSYRLYMTSGNKFAFSISTNGASGTVATITGSTTTIDKGAWYHVAGVYDTSAQTLNLYVNGVSDATQVGSAGASISDNASNLYLGAKENTSGSLDTYFLGILDEIRVSDAVRYTSNFTAPSSPIVPDTNSSALFHFDEGGNDPRDTGKALDESGNSNDATITGAVWVTGFIGYDGPSEFGAHTGSNNATVLTDSTASWATNEWAGYILFNSTDASHGIVSSNTVNTLTASMAGGTENDWDSGDLFALSPDLGKPLAQSFADQYGVFIEEATTNKITNPSFENTTYDTSWSEGSGSGVIWAVSRTTANVSGGTQDITNSNLGGNTPKAVWIIGSYATSDGVARDHSGMSIGAATGTTNEWYITMKSEHLLSTPTDDSDSATGTDATILISDPVNDSGTTISIEGKAEFSSFITNGVRINWTTTPTEAFFLTVIFVAGSNVQAYAGTEDLANTACDGINNKINITAPGFQPDVIMGGAGPVVPNSPFNGGFGFAYYNGSAVTQRGFLQRHGGITPNPGLSRVLGSDTGANAGIVGQLTGAAVDWTGEILDFDANGFSVCPRTNGANSLDLNYLALDLGTTTAWVGTDTTPTSTGNSAETGPNLTPQFVYQIMNFAEAINTNYSTALNGSFGFGAFDANDEFATSIAVEDNSNPTDTQSLSDNTAINIPDGNGDTGVIGSFVSFDTNTGYTINYSNVTAAGKVFPTLAIQALTFLTKTIETSTPYVKFGSRSTKIVASGANTSLVNTVSPGNTNTHTHSLYVYRGTAGNIGGTVDNTIAQVLWEGVAQSSTTYENVGGGWWRLSYSAATTNSANTYGVWIANGETLYVDGFQLEEKAFASTYTDGSLGDGYSWSGTINSSTSARVAADLDYPTSSNIAASAGTVSFWIKPNWAGNDGREHTFFDTDTSAGSLKLYKDTSNNLILSDGTNSASKSISGWAKNDWHHIVADWGSSNMHVYVDSVAGTAAGAFSAPTLGTNLYLGQSKTNANLANASLGDFRVFDAVLSSAEITDIYQSGHIAGQQSYSVDYFSNTSGQDPVAIWHFDEASGTIANDSTPYANHLTLSGPTWETQSVGSGNLRTRNLSFDGTNDYLSRDYDSDFNFAAESFSISGWFRHPTTISGTDTILARHGTAGFKVYMNSSGFICFAIDADSTWSPTDEACSTVSYADSAWHNFVAVKSGISTLILYIDSRQVDTEVVDASGSLNSNSNIYIGIDTDVTSNPWSGYLDEIVIYPYARSATQVQQDYSGGQVSTLFGTSTQDPFSNNLIGYWKMDHTSGDATDSSGNGITLTNQSSVAYVGGKFGNGIDLIPASTDYFSTTTDINNLQTISFWVYPDTVTTNYLLSFSDSIYISISSGTLAANGFTGTFYVNGAPSTTLSASVWQFVTVTTPALNAADTYVGRVGTSANYMDGKLDELRIFNLALTPSEIRSLYSWAPGPVGYWTMDEGRWTNDCSTSTVLDTSGNGNGGKSCPSSTGPLGGSTGKFGNAGTYDGVNDRIDIADNLALDVGPAATWEAWINASILPSVAGRTFNILDKWTGGGNQRSYLLGVDSATNKIYATIDPDGTAASDILSIADNAITANTWIHAALVCDGTKCNMFVNGVKQADQDALTAIHKGTAILTLGADNAADNTEAFQGMIDEVKIYNYARTSSQIVEDMNSNHPVPGSPVGSYVARWKMDDSIGTTANDTTSQNNDLTLSSASWTNTGKFTGAWNGTGANWLARNDDPDFDFTTGEDFSLSLWFKSDGSGNPAGGETLLNKRVPTNNPGYRLSFAPLTGQLSCDIDDDTSSFPEDTAQSATDYYDGSWHHAVCVRDITADSLLLYIDGVLAGSDTNLDATGDLSNADNLSLGDGNESDDGDEFTGDIDEVKIFRLALTSDQVKIDYNFSSSQTMGKVDDQADEGYSLPNPVGWWKIDEGTGTSTVSDFSGSAIDLTMNNFESTDWSQYKRFAHQSFALTFDGTTEYLSRTDNPSFDFGTGNFSLLAWAKHSTISAADYLITKADATTGGYKLYMDDSGDFCFAIDDDGTWTPTPDDSACTSGIDYDDNSWHLVAATRNSGIINLYVDGKLVAVDNALTATDISNTNSLYVGIDRDASTGGWDGQIDDVIIHNSALTASQIAYVFNRSAPFAWYKLDECTGSTANNSARTIADTAAGFPGTITIGSGGENTLGDCATSSTAWGSGVTGKFNASLDFDGSDDYINIGDQSAFEPMDNAPFTVEAWINRDTFTTLDVIVAKDNDITTPTDDGWHLYISPSDAINFIIGSGSSSHTVTSVSPYLITASGWNHILATFDGTTGYIYLNGVLAATGVGSVLQPDNAVNVTIGAESDAGNPFDGKIDEVKFYNSFFAADQAKRLYNQGASVRFGPFTGSP